MQDCNFQKLQFCTFDPNSSYVAEALAIKEYEVYKKQLDQLIESDFDRVVKKLLEG